MNKKKPETSISHEISRLIKVVAELRNPENGCPWDKLQTHQSLIPFVLEEAHEVVNAIRENNDDNLCEELGDLLLQVIFHAQIANEEKRFNLEDIAAKVTEKLIRRHPHVFLDKKITNLQEVENIWDEIKEIEKKEKGNDSKLSTKIKDKIRSQPSMFGSMYISKKTSKIGFDWKNIEYIWNKLNEEITELRGALNENNLPNTEEEIGDVLFTVINIARWYKINPEEALAKTNKKFLDRFSYIESNIKGNFKNKTINEIESLWKEAKIFLKK